MNYKHEIKKLKCLNYGLLFLVLLMFGGLLNTYVISSNGGKMPVLSTYSSGGTNSHFYYSDKETINNFIFTDIIKLPKSTWSIGDLFLILGALGLTFSIIKLGLIRIKHKQEKPIQEVHKQN